MSINEQRSKDIFWRLMSIINDGNDSRPLDTFNNNPSHKPLFNSIIDFNANDINDTACITPSDRRCAPIKDEIKLSINTAFSVANIRAANAANLNKTFFTQGNTIDILKPSSKMFLPREITDNLYENNRRTVRSINDIPYCIIYGNLKGSSDTVFHTTSAIVYKRKIYNFGYTSVDHIVSHLADPTTPIQAVILTPETADLKYQYFILDIQILTSQIVRRINYYLYGTLLVPVSSVNGNRISFGENLLYLPNTRKYWKFRNVFNTMLTGMCVDMQNCASLMEHIFGINCRYWLFSSPDKCRRGNHSFSIPQLNRILTAIKEDEIGAFTMALAEHGAY